MADIDTNTVDVSTETAPAATAETETAAETADTELARLRAEIARQKAALDKATKEAGDARKALRAKQSAEEIAAEEKRIADEERDRKLAEYEKRFTVAETAKKVMTFVGTEDASTTIAEYLYGAADVDGAVDALMKAWNAREKALRLEFGKIPAPSAGQIEGAVITKEQIDAMSYKQRVEFANKYPSDYNKIMGRK